MACVYCQLNVLQQMAALCLLCTAFAFSACPGSYSDTPTSLACTLPVSRFLFQLVIFLASVQGGYVMDSGKGKEGSHSLSPYWLDAFYNKVKILHRYVLFLLKSKKKLGGRHHPLHVCPTYSIFWICHCQHFSIGWFVFSLARLHKKVQADLVEVFREDSTLPSLEAVRFWWWFGFTSEWRILAQYGKASQNQLEKHSESADLRQVFEKSQ